MEDQVDVSAKIIRNYLDENELGNLKDDEYEKMFSDFKQEFSPDLLENLNGLNLLNKLFLHDKDQQNLSYTLEFSREYRNAGGIGGGSAYNYALFKNKDGQWIYGTSKKNSQTLDENEASEIAALLRDKLVEGAGHIKNCKLETIDDYVNLEEKLDEIFDDCLLKPTFSWIHKYYALIFPEKFPLIHSNAMKIDFLNKFNINPEDSYYAQDAQFYSLSKKAGIIFYSLFNEKVVRLFFKGGKDIWEPLNSSGEGIGDGDIKTTRYWIYSPGPGAEMWEEFYREGIMGIGWSELGNLSEYSDKKEIQSKLKEIYKDGLKHVMDTHAIWQFSNEISKGDVIFVKKGMGEIIGRGIVKSDYDFDEKWRFYPNIRKVTWTHKGNWKYKKGKLPVKTLTDFTNYKEYVEYINGLIGDGEIIDKHISEDYQEYPIEKFLEEVYISEDEYWTLRNLLINKKNLIVQGAPGVGKTFMAKRLAYSIMSVKDTERVRMVQFHQSYSYEDFVMGYRPYENGFVLRKGSFYNFCKEAEEDSENDYFFIIDEINRGNLSKIFGELFMLIEADKRGEKNKIQLLYADEEFFIPKNVHIIGLMNTADRSLAMIDYALRRRFAFFDLKPGFDSDGFKIYQDALEDSRFDNLVEVMKELNYEIKNDESLGEGFRIGHSYLCNVKSGDVEDRLIYIVEYELIPLLKEYWFDESDKVSYWSDKLRSAVQ